MTAACEVRSVSYRYGETVALSDVSFRLGAGDHAALLGPNGSGKSTLLQCLATLRVPASGELLVAGHSTRTQAALARQNLAVVFQEPSLDKKLTIWENLLCAAALFGLAPKVAKERATQLLNLLGLDDRREERTEKLSGGLRRRADLARALLARPKFLILDEPTSGLDLGARIDFWNALERSAKEDGTTWLLATHHMDEARRARRLLFLRQGKLVLEGAVEQLLREAGPSVIAIESSASDTVDRLRARFGVSPRVVGNEILFEKTDAVALLPAIAAELGASATALTVRQAGIDDLYFRHTGAA